MLERGRLYKSRRSIGVGEVLLAHVCPSWRRSTARLIRKPWESITHELHDLAGGLRKEVGVDERVEVAVEHALGVSGLVTGAGILDLLVGVEDIASDPLAAEACVGGATPLLRHHCLALLLRALDEPGLEDAHRRLLIGRL